MNNNQGNNQINNQQNMNMMQNNYQNINNQQVNMQMNMNNQSNLQVNNIRTRKMNFGLLIGLGFIGVVVIILGIFLINSIIKSDLNSNTINENFNNINSGNVTLSMTTRNTINKYDSSYYMITDADYMYFVENKSDEIIVRDSSGEQILPLDGDKLTIYDYKYLGNSYFAYERGKSVVVVKDKKEVFNTDNVLVNNVGFKADHFYYKNNILYFSMFVGKTYAYDLKNNKLLWQVDGYFSSDYELDDKFLRITDVPNDSRLTPNTIIDYNGNKIISGADILMSDEMFKEYDTQIYTSRGDYYLEVKKNAYVKVYNLNKEYVKEISLGEIDGYVYSFNNIYDSGLFIIEKTKSNPYFKSSLLYNSNGQLLIEAADFEGLSSTKSNLHYYLSKNMDLVKKKMQDLSSTCVLIKNGFVYEEYAKCQEFTYYSAENDVGGFTNDYLLYYIDEDKNDYLYNSYVVMNLKNMKKIEEPVDYNGNQNIKVYRQSPSGKYVILSTGNEFYVYDEELNFKYKAEDVLYPVDDNYVLNIKDMELINVFTNDTNKLDVKGDYYTNNAYGIVTKDATNYYLYSFN